MPGLGVAAPNRVSFYPKLRECQMLDLDGLIAFGRQYEKSQKFRDWVDQVLPYIESQDYEYELIHNEIERTNWCGKSKQYVDKVYVYFDCRVRLTDDAGAFFCDIPVFKVHEEGIAGQVDRRLKRAYKERQTVRAKQKKLLDRTKSEQRKKALHDFTELAGSV